MSDLQHTPNSADAKPFQCCHESGFIAMTIGGDRPAALVFNPAAPPASFAGAALSRAHQLHSALALWADVSAGEADALEVALHLEPIAEEVRMLLEELCTRLSDRKCATP